MPGMPIQVTTVGTVSDDVKVVNGSTALTVGLAAGTDIDQVATVGTVTDDVKVVNGSTALTVGLAAGTDINEVTTVGTVTNDVKVVNGATALTVGLAAGTDIDEVTTVGTVTNDVKVVNGATALEVGLAAGTTIGLAAGTDIDEVTTVGTVTNDVKVVNGATALEVGLAAGTTVGLAAGTNIIGKVENQLVFTNEDSFGAVTPLTPKAVGIAETVNADTQDISLESSYNWFIKNEGTVADQDITLVVELSPDGTNWVEDTGTIISLPFGESKMITVTNFLQYTRFVITGGAAATTVISSFQSQH